MNVTSFVCKIHRILSKRLDELKTYHNSCKTLVGKIDVNCQISLCHIVIPVTFSAFPNFLIIDIYLRSCKVYFYISQVEKELVFL